MLSSAIIKRCGGCGKGLDRLVSILKLGSSPPACSMRPVATWQGEETHYPLELLECLDCGLVQLSCIVDPRIVFHGDYPYSSGNTKALHTNFEHLQAQVTAAGVLAPGDLIVDIGANDGTLLSKFGPECRRLGVEPTKQGQRLEAVGALWAPEPFTDELARSLRAEHGDAKLITAANVLAHVPDIHDVLDGVKRLLAEDGVFVAENHDLASIINGGQWDTVYHEHLRYYTPDSWARLLDGHGLRPIEVEAIPTHGGSFRTYATHRIYEPKDRPLELPELDGFAQRTHRNRQELRSAVANAGTHGRVVGIGAAARATTVIHYCGLSRNDLEWIAEVPSSDKIGHMMPGTDIPVVDEKLLFDEQPEYAVLFSWHVAAGIIPKLRERGYLGAIIVPLPSVTISSGERWR